MKYKVGDKARVIDNIISHEFDMGTIVEIKIVDEVDQQYQTTDGWWVCDEELQDVWDNFDETYLSYTYSAEARDLVEMFMNAHSGKMSDSSRIEWPTAVNIARIHVGILMEALSKPDAWSIKELDNILIELDK